MTRKNTTTRPRAVDLFCGAGGMSLGFERAGFDIVLSVDFDPHHVATHERNFPYGPAWVKSVAELKGAEISEEFGEIDLLFGGPPCQGFSHMGLRNVDDPRNSLVAEFLRVAAELRPKAVVMENVPGLGTGPTKHVLTMAIQRLEEAGYVVTHPVQTLNALDFGVPQHRERLFLLAVRSDISVQAICYPDSNGTRNKVWDALHDLPGISSDEAGAVTKPYDKPPRSRYARMARGEVREADDLSYPRIWDSEICSGCNPVVHSDKTVELYAATEPGTMVPGHRLPRLSNDGYSPTLRAGSSSDHGSYTAPRPVHPVEPRCITPREAARLHGYPDWFEFYPSKWHAYRQIGNSVCPPVAHAVGRKVREAIRTDKGRQPSKFLELSEIRKPVTQNKNHARLREVDEFPKVLSSLFELCMEDKLFRKRFDAQDIARAVALSGAQLPRIEAENFLGAVARSRNVLKHVAELHAKGWTIRADGRGGGEFVSVGTPGTLEDRDKIRVSSADLTSAVPLSGEFDCVYCVLEAPEVWERLRESGWEGLGEIQLERNLLGEIECQSPIATAKVGDLERSVLVVLAEGAKLPKRSQVFASMKEARTDFAMVLGVMTSQHLLGLLWEPQDGSAIEAARVALRLNGSCTAFAETR